MEILWEHKIPIPYINVIKEFNKSNKAKIKTPQGFTEQVPVPTRIRQGNSISPVLFNLIMDKIINSVEEVAGGYRMGQQSIKMLCYADDAILMADNEDDLQQLLYRFQTKARALIWRSMEKT
ncbi:hypothetical protein Trydic_g6171 [Trypoxylus dichotomus]